ncbi:photosynthetic reaction center cytochrome c subunit [Fulvimarina endophytica]|uniref:Photosynthetic reaction center cytochrome c subunit n=1 Tax=Fulvimarina endophytica TaxID=2293836 RepID=A0A371X6W7_9HYPH|nr:photosynthetic reaction center cytochrome PufC [Fulvimarina endophytica]RFC64953.1 photosynthetic reaction center cytochrome c subunit [Fulvimarina endophytica]
MTNERRKRKAPRHRVAPIITGVLALAAVLVILTVPPWVLPPIDAISTGPRAIEMVQFKDADRKPNYTLPEALPAAEPYEGEQKASELYENVEVLGDLSEGEFTRLMLAITEWVSPEQGCEYCHNVEEGFASDAVYTKVVARQMLKMTRHLNTAWPEHVAPAGVTCFTCHRGKNVPDESWYKQNPPSGDQFMGKPRPWHLEAKTIQQFFPSVPYQEYYLDEQPQYKIQASQPLVSASGRSNTAREQSAEDMYLLMMQNANSLGVNCTYCHNSRAFWDWSQSPPFRWIAYWGIRMVRDINIDYITPITDVFPPERLGPLGDPAKVHCGTCHRGETKPLGGYDLMHAYTAGLSEDGNVPDPSPKQAILLGTAKPVAAEGNAFDQEGEVQPTPAPVSESAIEQSVAPDQSGSQSGDGVEYESQTEPGQPVDAPAIEGATEALPPESPTQSAPPGDYPTGVDAPDGAAPQQMRPGTSVVDEDGTADAPSAGDPGTGSEALTATDPEPASPTDGTSQPTPQNEGNTSMTPGQQPENSVGGAGSAGEASAQQPSGSASGASAGNGSQAAPASGGSGSGGNRTPTITVLPRPSN